MPAALGHVRTHNADLGGRPVHVVASRQVRRSLELVAMDKLLPLHDTLEDALATAAALGTGEKGRYLTALTFGNVHGVYKPGNVKLRPEVLQAAQKAVAEKYGKDEPFDLVFHGGSGSLP